MTRTYTGSTSSMVSERELRGRALSREAAAEGIVLLQNNGVLPLQDTKPVALYGAGSLFLSKGGTGSGDVNDRQCISPSEGLRAAGVPIANDAYLAAYQKIYETERENWRSCVLSHVNEDPRSLLESYLSHPFLIPDGPGIEKADADTALYILSRQAGEGADRRLDPGDYYLTEGEQRDIDTLRRMYGKLILVLNCGGPVDLTYIDTVQPDALLFLSQPGMEGGNALADVLLGKVSPCGKMTDTWARNYTDYPSAKTFLTSADYSERYEDGIYVGYRYFDTFGVRPRICFGFGMSYTDFSIHVSNSILRGSRLILEISVKNVGNVPGKEVVQLYCTCPRGKLDKEHIRLCGFAKTKLLASNECCTLEIQTDMAELWSYDPETGCKILEKGSYHFTIGNSSDARKPAATVILDEEAVLADLHRLVPEEHIQTLCAPAEMVTEISPTAPVLLLSASQIGKDSPVYEKSPMPEQLCRCVEALSFEQLCRMTSGNPVRGQNISDTFGSSGVQVPGAAGETSNVAENEPWRIRSLVLADGPAGLRISQKYYVMADGSIEKPSFGDTLERGLFAAPRVKKSGETTYYQFCTSFPVGTMLAQTWDTELARRVGEMVAEEMREYCVDIWLAPGMNIHRNPLCGRNFEYYSEDPLLTGSIAAALTMGVQSKGDRGTTIKHFACNQREDHRKQSNSIVSERALREIYLRGFEIAIKQAKPAALMTSYNLLNGIHTANHYGLLTEVLRMEWGYKGLVMSDWTTTGAGGSSPVECMRAGNDLIMPGTEVDIAEIREAVRTGRLPIEDVRYCVGHLVAASASLTESADHYGH